MESSQSRDRATDTYYIYPSYPCYQFILASLLQTMFCPHLLVVLALFLATFVAAADLYKILDSAPRLPFASAVLNSLSYSS